MPAPDAPAALRLGRRALLVAGIAAMHLLVAGCGRDDDQANPPLPALLKGATAASGWASACPPRDERERKMIESSRRLALSPELDTRVKERFPPGTQSRALMEALQGEGFRDSGHCANDATISIATFRRKGDGLLSHSTFAAVYWKVDEKNAVVWTAGMVFYGGP